MPRVFYSLIPRWHAAGKCAILASELSLSLVAVPQVEAQNTAGLKDFVVLVPGFGSLGFEAKGFKFVGLLFLILGGLRVRCAELSVWCS